VAQELVALRYGNNMMSQEYSWITVSGMPTNLLHSKIVLRESESIWLDILVQESAKLSSLDIEIINSIE
jgi:hypothetical protein